MGATIKAPTPAPGQIWASIDPREEGRTIRVVDISGDSVICVNVSNSKRTQVLIDTKDPWIKDTRGKTTRIRADRLRPISNGWTLVDAGPGVTADPMVVALTAHQPDGTTFGSWGVGFPCTCGETIRHEYDAHGYSEDAWGNARSLFAQHQVARIRESQS